MSELKTVDEIEINYSKSQTYWRIKKLVENGLMDPPERGERNKYLLSQEDVNLLEKLAELEESRETVKEAIDELATKWPEEKSGPVSSDTLEDMEKRISELEDRMDSIEDRLNLQNDRIEQFRKNWRDQLKEGVEKVKDLFGSK